MELRKISIILIIVKLPVITTWETEKCATSASIADFALVSHVIETVSRKQPLTCIIACELNPRCASVNFDFSTTSCEMSDKIVESHPGDLHPRLGWLYISILYREDLTLGSDSHVTPVPTVPTKSVCDHVICENGGTCLETSDPGKFKCMCFPDYTGRSCEGIDLCNRFELCFTCRHFQLGDPNNTYIIDIAIDIDIETDKNIT